MVFCLIDFVFCSNKIKNNVQKTPIHKMKTRGGITQLGILHHTTRLVATRNLAYYNVQLGLSQRTTRLITIREPPAHALRAGGSRHESRRLISLRPTLLVLVLRHPSQHIPTVQHRNACGRWLRNVPDLRIRQYKQPA